MQSVLRKIYLVFFFLYLLVPVLVVIVLSFSPSSNLEFSFGRISLKWYLDAFSSSKWINPLLLSLKIALFTAIGSTTMSLLFVIGAENLNSRVRLVLFTLLLSPLLMPMLVIGVALFFWFSTLQIIDSSIALTLAHILISFPIAIWIINDANQVINRDLDKTALCLGDNSYRSFMKVRLPLLKYSLVICFIITFIISFDEPVIALFIAGTRNVTLPKAMWDGIRYEINPTLMVVSTLVIFFTSILTVIVIYLEKIATQKRSL